MADPALLDDYMRQMAGRGKVYEGATLPADLEYGIEGQCFKNCLLAALGSDGKYLYCEGIGICLGEAYVHAWLVDKGQRVAYDLTWRVRNEKTGFEFPAPAMYKGVVLDTEACKRYVMSTGKSGIIPNREARPRLYKRVLKASNLL
jgi:hypothetical protein